SGRCGNRWLWDSVCTRGLYPHGPHPSTISPSESGFWIMTLTMALGASLVGVVSGSLWAIVIESLRLNSGHISFRMNRIPFRHHWGMLFICGFIVFWLVALLRSRVKLPPMNTRTHSQVSLH